MDYKDVGVALEESSVYTLITSSKTLRYIVPGHRQNLATAIPNLADVRVEGCVQRLFNYHVVVLPLRF